MGGTNHTLISRLPATTPKYCCGFDTLIFFRFSDLVTMYIRRTFQDPPGSLAWVFDVPTMLVGIDVSHAEPYSDRESMAAVVASMDGRASQYCAYLSAQSNRVEMVSALEDAIVNLLQTFKRKNNVFPQHIIVYRDGVSDGQFPIVLEKELPQIKNAFALVGLLEDAVKISVVICQKGHHTRLVSPLYHFFSFKAPPYALFSLKLGV